MNHSLLFITFCLLLTGFFNSQPKPKSIDTSLLIGTWKENTGEYGYSINTFNADKTYYGESFDKETPSASITFRGTWKVENDVLIYLVTESSNPQFPWINKPIRDRILTINASQFTYESVDYGYKSTMQKH